MEIVDKAITLHRVYNCPTRGIVGWLGVKFLKDSVKPVSD